VISPWDFMSSIEFNMAILEPPSETVNKTCGRHVANCLRALYGFIWLYMALYGFLWLYDVQITFGAFKQLGSSSPMN